MRSFKRVLAVAVLIAIVAVANCTLSYLLCPYTTARVEVHNLENGGYEQLIVGTSHGKSGIDPQVLTDASGMETLNLCRGGEYPEDVFYLVKEAAAHNDLKRVIYEVDPAYWEVKPNQIADYVVYYQELPFSLNKVQYFWNKMLNADYRTGLTTWYLYRNNLKSIPDNLRMKKSEAYKQYQLVDSFQTEGQSYTERGFIAINQLPSDRSTEDIPTLWSGAGAREESQRAAEKLVSFCKEKGIELVLVILPISDETYEKYQSNYQDAEDYMADFAAENQVKLISYWGENRDSEFGATDLYVDYDGHMYKETAAAFSIKLAGALVE